MEEEKNINNKEIKDNIKSEKEQKETKVTKTKRKTRKRTIIVLVALFIAIIEWFTTNHRKHVNKIRQKKLPESFWSQIVHLFCSAVYHLLKA